MVNKINQAKVVYNNQTAIIMTSQMWQRSQSLFFSNYDFESSYEK